MEAANPSFWLKNSWSYDQLHIPNNNSSPSPVGSRYVVGSAMLKAMNAQSKRENRCSKCKSTKYNVLRCPKKVERGDDLELVPTQ
jgi:hypothetical protein